MNKKFKLTQETKEWYGTKFYRIEAITSFGNVDKGEKGGWVEKEDNVSREGDAWVYGNAQVYGDAQVSGNAQVSGDAWVSGNARVSGNASILWMSKVGGEFGTLTAFKNKDAGITVTRGCFIGSLDEFRAKVVKTHGGTLHEKAYLGLVNYIEFHFNELHPFIKDEKKATDQHDRPHN